MRNRNELVTVPPDFPRHADIASVAGVHPKLTVIRDASSGNYVAQRDSDETEERFTVCEDLAEQLASKCSRNRNSKYRHLSEREILGQLRQLLLASAWGTPAEMRWTVQRTAQKLGWAWEPSAVSE